MREVGEEGGGGGVDREEGNGGLTMMPLGVWTMPKFDFLASEAHRLETV